MPSRLEEECSTDSQEQIKFTITFNNHPHILDKAVYNVERLRCRRPRLVLGESVQPLKNRLDLILSKKLLDEIFYIALSHVTHQERRTHLDVLA